MTVAPLLLDTCAAMYIIANGQMRDEAVAAIDAASDHGEPVFISPITAWEVGTLARKCRFRSSYTPQRWFERLMRSPNAALAAMTPELLLASSFLPGDFHNDPADRIIAATAREYGYTVVTRDRALLAYGEAGHIRALAC